MIEKIHFEAITQSLAVLHNDAGQVAQRLMSGQPDGSAAPSELSEWLSRLMDLRRRLEASPFTLATHLDLTAEELALIRTGVAMRRRQHAATGESQEQQYRSSAIRGQISQQTAALDALLAGPLVAVTPARRPRLGDYFTVEGLERHGALGQLRTRERDPKHRILLSSSLITPDLATLRNECEERGVAVGVVFVDLDSFKAINTALGEVMVDRTVLPQVLSSVETVAYGHGHAYRFGGDEFVLLLLNTTEKHALLVAQALSSAIAAVDMPAGVGPVTASVGVWIASNESHLTESELVQKASEAKQKAKDLGRRKIVIRTERASTFDESIYPTVA